MSYKTISHSYQGEVLVTDKADKGVVENAQTFDAGVPAFADCHLVRLDKVETGLVSWRMKIPSGLEVRITESPTRAVQFTRRRETKCHYVVFRGFAACITNNGIDMAFAGHSNFVLDVEADTDYVIITSAGSAISFMETNRTTSNPVNDSLYKDASSLTDTQLFERFAKESKLSLDQVRKLAELSLTNIQDNQST